LRRIDAPKQPKKRTRAKVDRPKQAYVYASQKRAMGGGPGPGSGPMTTTTAAGGASPAATATALGRRRSPPPRDDDDEDYYDEDDGDNGGGGDAASAEAGRGGGTTTTRRPPPQMSEAERERRGRAAEFARSVGLDPAGQRADPIPGDGPEDVPRIVGRIRVDGGGGGGDVGIVRVRALQATRMGDTGGQNEGRGWRQEGWQCDDDDDYDGASGGRNRRRRARGGSNDDDRVGIVDDDFDAREDQARQGLRRGDRRLHLR
jgi:hypothetical protein